MAQIRRYPWVRHLRSETTSHILAYRDGRLVRSGPGLAFWFRPLRAALAEVPIDDRDLSFEFSGRTQDHQDLAVQGVITYRVVDPELTAKRVDFSLDPITGRHQKQPLEQLATHLVGLARQASLQHVAQAPIRDLLGSGLEVIQHRIEVALGQATSLADIGIEVVDVRIHRLAPDADLERALQTPTREHLQQAADEATFQRRAHAVEKERAIAENELGNQIELTKRREQLVTQEGHNARIEAEERVLARKVEALGRAEETRIAAQAKAERVRVVEGARAEAERARNEAYRDVPPAIALAFAAQEVAKHLAVDQLNLGTDVLSALARQFVAPTRIDARGER